MEILNIYKNKYVKIKWIKYIVFALIIIFLSLDISHARSRYYDDFDNYEEDLNYDEGVYKRVNPENKAKSEIFALLSLFWIGILIYFSHKGKSS